MVPYEIQKQKTPVLLSSFKVFSCSNLNHRVKLQIITNYSFEFTVNLLTE
jgi:hypothetical protein